MFERGFDQQVKHLATVPDGFLVRLTMGHWSEYSALPFRQGYEKCLISI